MRCRPQCGLRGGIESLAERLSKNVQRETESDPGNLISFLVGQGSARARTSC
jgi:hypothetical protein